MLLAHIFPHPQNFELATEFATCHGDLLFLLNLMKWQVSDIITFWYVFKAILSNVVVLAYLSLSVACIT